MDSVPNQEEASTHKDSSSEQEIDSEVTFNPHQAFVSMFMPYIEGSKMDWTMNDGLYSRFLKWKLKCKHILECEFAMLVEKENVRK